MSPLSKRRQPPLCFAGSIYGSRSQAVFDMLLEPVELRNDEILKIAPPQKNGPNFQTPYSKSMIMVSFCWKKTVLTDEVKNNFMFLIILKELTIISVPFFLGHPVYRALMNMALKVWCAGTIAVILPDFSLRGIPLKNVGQHHTFWRCFH